MIVYQVWYETSVGATFSTREKALKFLQDQGEMGPYEGYPDIEEIVVDNGKFMRIR